MNTPLRVIDTGLNSARWNIAVTAALSELHLGGSLEDTLRLHCYRRSVLLGRHQLLDDAVDRSFCARKGIEIARRVTGGGAVYMSPGVLAWDLVMARSAAASLEAVSTKVCGAIATALASFGFAARFRPPGDVVIGGQKVSGSAGWHDGCSLVHQGTVLIDADLEEMARVLRMPVAADIPLPVMTLADGGSAPDFQSVANAVSDAIAQALDRRPVRGRLSTLESDMATKFLAEEIGTDEFVEGEEPAHSQPASLPA
ncbi:lipoate--protein ligase family protein [Pseudaminobacter arsenicus]|uniref:Lipoate--protein ligase family protein n=1 Tax=Borborobacter arsenicus TaxID=1851146 RepID=A0A432V4L3_9HYPH|nr:lipoate--protein ligase family protein [Pseudaminobacter arsenicus]RUM97089.1 lipoate--protein ligase family protein [Pseudaminobacter arsenicus]